MGKSVKEREETKYIRQLRKQIIRLKRENAQLRKANSKIDNDYAEYTAAIEAEEECKKLEEDWDVKKDKFRCPKCRSEDASKLELRGLEYYHCRECGSKGRLAENERKSV